MRMTGQVVTFFNNRGFGFITNSEGTSIFFHTSHFLRAGAEGEDRKPRLGELVSFEVAPAVMLGKGPQAVKIRPLEVEAGVEALGKLAVGVQ